MVAEVVFRCCKRFLFILLARSGTAQSSQACKSRARMVARSRLEASDTAEKGTRPDAWTSKPTEGHVKKGQRDVLAEGKLLVSAASAPSDARAHRIMRFALPAPHKPGVKCPSAAPLDAPAGFSARTADIGSVAPVR
jgi:hypothetical protein